MSNTVDSLDIKVSSSATVATKALDSLSSTLKSLKVQVDVNSSAYVKLSKNLDNVSKSSTKSGKSIKDTIANLGLSAVTIGAIGTAIGRVVSLSTQYIENVNLFAVSMDDYAQEAMNYAEQVQEIMGIDVSDWIRNQSIFMTLATGFGVASDRAYTMSKNLTQLGYDISSFFNLDLEQSMQKLESGLAGELEPLRRIGYDLSVARLQQEAYNLGIEKSVSAMTQAEKAQLRYYAIMTQVTTVQGDMARTLEQPANQMRILTANLQMAARAIGNIFIPALNAILPVAIAVVQVITEIINAVAALFGFEVVMPEYDTIGNIETGTGGIADNLDEANGNAKKLKNNLLGIDELNIISQDSGGSGLGDIAGGGSSLDIPLPEYDFLGDAMNERIASIKQAIEDLLPILAAVGLALAGWKLADLLADLFGIDRSLLTLKDRLSIIAGLALTVGGGILYLQGAFDALENGVDWDNLTKMLLGIAGIGSGLYLVFKPFLGTNMAGVIGWFSSAAAAIGLLGISLNDIAKNGANYMNFFGAFAGLGTSTYAAYKGADKLAQVIRKSKKDFQIFGQTISKDVLVGLTDCIAPAVAFGGSLATLSTYIGDIVENGSNTQNTLGLLSTGIAAITSAVLLCTAAMNVNPIFGGITIAVTAIAGLVTVIGSVTNALKQLDPATQETAIKLEVFKGWVDETKAAAEEAATSVANIKSSVENLQTTADTFATANSLADAIFDIYEKADRTNLETDQMKALIESLNSLGIDGLKLEYDELSDKINMTRDEVQKLIEKQLELSYTQALSDAYGQALVEQRDARRDTVKAVEELAEMEGELNAMGDKTAGNAREWNTLNQQIKDQKTYIADLAGSYDDLSTYAQDLKSDLTSIISGETSMSSIINGELDQVVAYSTEAGTMTAEQFKTSLQSSFTEEEFSIIESIMGEDYFTEAKEAGTELGSNMTIGIGNGITQDPTAELAMDEESKRILDIARENFAINSPSLVMQEMGSYLVQGLGLGIQEGSASLQTIIATLAQNVLTWFSQGLMGGTGMGMSASGGQGETTGGFTGIAQTMMTSFTTAINNAIPTVQTAINTWVTTVLNTFKGNNEVGINEVVFKGYATDITTAFLKEVQAKAPEIVTQFTTLATDINTTFSTTASAEVWRGYGEAMVQGAIAGVQAMGPSLVAEVRALAAEVNAAFQVSLDINSPSKVFEKNGMYIVSGLTKGIVENQDKAISAVSSFGTNLVDTSKAIAKVDYSKLSVKGGFSYMNNATVEQDGFEEAMTSFYNSVLAPQMNALVDNTQRQADKNESVTVQIGNQEVANAVKQQQRANGYSFIRG